MKINKLPSEIFNRIAAGEVVESPASIVKELAENAIDAGATEICVSVRGGGIDKISITDNGCGIDFDDMPTAFLPHATSKIKNLDDLDTISTLGFRGEALPSIGAVADVTMISRTANSEIGGKIVYKGGRLISHEECGTGLGTTVTVENLFEHIPARKKFLAKPSREETKIFTLIEHLVLSNPDIVFKFDSETKHFSSPGEGLKSAVFAVYGDAVLKNTVEVNLTETPVTVTGFTCLPTYTKPSRNYQNIIINGRYVESVDIQYAVYSVYSAYLMKRQYPLFVLHITMPYDMVDVNVHPSKMQVKFADTTKIKSIVARAVKNAVMPRLTEPKKLDLMDDDFKDDYKSSGNEQYGKSSHNLFKSFFQSVPSQPSTPQAADLGTFGPVGSGADNFEDEVESKPTTTQTIDSYTDLYEPVADFTQKQQVFAPAECTCIGKLFNTYLILERGDLCYFIDQHAAHEKLLYDKLLKKYEEKRLQTQPLMIPFVFDVSAADAELLSENTKLLEDCGFGISPFGEYTFTLSYLPYECVGIDLQLFVSDMLALINSREKSPMIMKERLMQAACKAAVKGEIDDLNQSEIDALLDEMTARNITLFCPHGRPIVIGFTKKEIEKWFKRIV
ncbi:MAG: DNA mismatch repair endonuclease MutL [Clostridiales bacterium]|nr:DNA mismatch repair endonuclease MutL [Clostridiales bacterium]